MKQRIALFSFIVLLVGSSYVYCVEFPQLTGRVVDQANIISDNLEIQLTNELSIIEQSHGVQVVVATVNSLDGQPIDRFSIDLARQWGIGQKDQDNGVLFLIAPNERQMRIEVGYGLEGEIPDVIAWDIIQNRVRPKFLLGDMGGGVIEGVQGIVLAFAKQYPDISQSRPTPRKKRNNVSFLPLLIWLPLLVILIGFSSFRRGRGGGGLFTGLLVGSLVGHAARGMSSGGGFSGGFAGGGGSFGGGGAGGSW